jgi:6-phosphogluconolactonase (cycloisomerase 2 family)
MKRALLLLLLLLLTACGGGSGGGSRHAISGTVTVNGAPVSGVTLALAGADTGTATTDAGGAYRFRELADGSYTLTPTKAGCTFSPASLHVSLAGSDVPGCDFQSGQAAALVISGTIRTGGTPLSGITVTLSGAGTATTTTDASGAYRFTGLGSGSYTLTPSGSGRTFTPPSRSVVLDHADSTGNAFDGTPGACSLYVSTASAKVAAFSLAADSGALVPSGSPAVGSTASGAIAASPSGSRVYVANLDTNTLSVFGVDPDSGDLGLLGSVPTGTRPMGIAAEPSGRYVYAINYTSETISMFSVGTSGLLAELPGGPVACPSAPVAIAAEPSGKRVYVARYGTSELTVYTIDGDTGRLQATGTAVDPAAYWPYALGVSASGDCLYVANMGSNDVSVFRIDAGSGALSLVPGSPFSTAAVPSAVTGPSALAADPSGRWLYVANMSASTVSILAVDATTGGLSLTGTTAQGISTPYSVVMDPAGRHLYVASSGSDCIAAFAASPTTGALSPLSPALTSTGANSHPFAMVVVGR